jgi:hypothetical protein
MGMKDGLLTVALKFLSGSLLSSSIRPLLLSPARNKEKAG